MSGGRDPIGKLKSISNVKKKKKKKKKKKMMMKKPLVLFMVKNCRS